MYNFNAAQVASHGITFRGTVLVFQWFALQKATPPGLPTRTFSVTVDNRTVGSLGRSKSTTGGA